MKEDETKLARLTSRQASLMRLTQTFDPDLRHTLEIECRGAEPWKVASIKEHRDVQLR